MKKSSVPDVTMNQENAEESKFAKKRSSSSDSDGIVKMTTFKPKKDQEMFALKIISKAKVLESSQ